MEPETLATPSDPSAGASVRSPIGTLPVHHVSLDHAPLHEAGLNAGIGHAESLRHPIPLTNGHARAQAEVWARLHTTRIAVARVEAPPAPAIVQGYYLRAGKRMMDVVGAVLSLIVLSPVMALVALAIKLESRGPVLYRSTRIGKDGRPFTFLKFRSMVDGADRHRHTLSHLNEMDGPTFKISRDPRVTRIGRFLRVTSVDEIPQFLNVLRGEMSLVGPRPPIPEEVAQYEPWQLRRLDVRPGITCLWQISGRSRIGFQEWMRLDLEYIKRESFGLDVQILVRTIPAVISREGAY
jgi:exopolysaccharide biosynthesis polyprenyl glycosylphosphotransferase